MAGLDSNTKLLLPFNGQNGGKEIIDDGNTGHIVTQVGTAKVDTSIKKFGSGLVFFDGNSDYLSIPDSDDWNVFANTTDDWTLDLWARHNSLATSQTYFVQRIDAYNWWIVYWSSAGRLTLYGV